MVSSETYSLIHLILCFIYYYYYYLKTILSFYFSNLFFAIRDQTHDATCDATHDPTLDLTPVPICNLILDLIQSDPV